MAEPDYQVIVVGGGMAGCTAALASARMGARTLLIERGSYLGGNSTRAMVAPWQSYHASRIEQGAKLPRQVIGGIAQEFVDDLIALGASPGHIVDPIGFAGSITPIDTEVLKLYLHSKLAAQENLAVSLNNSVTQELLMAAAQVVDASGSAAAARLMGSAIHSPQQRQPMTWMFTMRDVDTAAIRRAQLSDPAQFVLHPGFSDIRDDYIAVSGFFRLVEEGKLSGEFSLLRDRLLFFSTPRPGEVLVNTTRIPAEHPQPRLEGMRQIAELSAFLVRHVPGFASARLSRIADDVGERESFRLEGRQTLSVEDIISGRKYSDAVARGCYPVDIHSAATDELLTREVGGPGWYDIPLACLESAEVPNLLVAGRCISSDRQGFASARVLPTAMATGQAAGMIAAGRAVGKNVDTFTCLSHVSLV